VHDKGGTVAALFWPVSAGAPADYLIPDNGSMGEANRIAYSKPEGFIDTLKENVFNDTAKIEYGVDHNVAQIAAYVIQLAAPELMTIHLFSVDHYEHQQGRTGDLVEKAIADADSSVGIIWKAIRDKGIADSTLLIVTGDHGFLDVTTSVNPNVWLKQAGLITNLKTGDWKARFFSVGGSTYLYLKNRSDKVTLNKVNEVLKNLPDSAKQYLRIIDRKKLNKIGGNPEVEFAISGLHGASFGNDTEGDAIKPGKGGSHGYFPDFKEIQTGFIAYGNSVNKGSVNEMNEKDITSVVIKALGLNFSTAEGKVPKGLFSHRGLLIIL
jgi:predicted AlkP superfamily pyrophosphatase or phosphodiesterase